MRVLKEQTSWLKNKLAIDFSLLNSSRPFSRSLVWSLFFLVMAKLVLSSQEEIVAFFLPHDDLWQVRAAARAYWGGAYEASKLYHLPVFPLFMEIVRIVGVPLRVALEFVYCGTACLFVGVLWRMGLPIGLTLLAAFTLIFHPASFQLPNRCGAEILLTPLMMGAIASSLWWWTVRHNSHSLRYAVYAAIWWSLAWNVRKESIVIVPIFAIMLLFAAVADRRSGWSKTVMTIAMMICFCLAMETAIKTANWSCWGLFATSVQTAPGFKSAIKSLQGIRPEKPIAFVPVPHDVRQRAYAVSPMFSKFKPFLDGKAARNYTVHSKPFTDSKNVMDLQENDISAGWFYWAFYDAVVALGYRTDPGEADRFLAKMGEEIQSALSDGRLPSRWVPKTMLDPSWMTWLPRFPESLCRVGRTFLNPAVPISPLYDFSVEEVHGKKFDRAANRRSYLTSPHYVKGEIAGWAYATSGLVQKIQIFSSPDPPLGSSPLDLSRPDIDTSRSVGFRVPLLVSSEAVWQKAEVGIVLEDGRVVRRLLSTIPIAQVVPITVDETIIYLAIDHIQPPKFKRNLLREAQKYLELWYLTLLSWLLWPGILAALVVVPSAVVKRQPIDLAILILAVAVTTRLLFFTVLDASAWPGDQPRYLYPAYPLSAIFILLVYARLLSFFHAGRCSSSRCESAGPSSV